MSVVGTGAVAVAGGLVGGGFSLGGQWLADRRARRVAAWTEHRQYIAALRLMVMDLQRSVQRLDGMKTDPRGFIELPRGAWLAYRAILAPRLEGSVLDDIVAVYNDIIEWNEILWGAFADSPPDLFHRSDQNRLDRDAAATLLTAKRGALENRVKAVACALTSVRDREASRTERALMQP